MGQCSTVFGLFGLFQTRPQESSTGCSERDGRVQDTAGYASTMSAHDGVAQAWLHL